MSDTSDSAMPPVLPTPFGTLLGIAPGNVPVYSSDYATARPEDFTDPFSYRSYIDGVFMGYKWQCVEFARRWLYLNHGTIFEDVPMAYDIFTLRHVRRVKDGALLPLQSFRNGSKRPPEPGAMMIWNEGGEFQMTGHVAIVTHVGEDYIEIAEQNVDHLSWEDRTYARRLTMERSEEGEHWVACFYDDVSILGWVIQSDDDREAERFETPDPHLFDLTLETLSPEARARLDLPWLDPAEPEQEAYLKAMHGIQALTLDPEEAAHYLTFSETASRVLTRATHELHALFMFATRAVLQNDELLARFDIPRVLWPKLHQSWEDRHNHMITGRFDFTLSADGLKVYEYNADSASCYFEAGFVQGKWAEQAGMEEYGEDPGEELFDRLVHAWQGSEVEGLLHILQDHDPEEDYHALYMKRAIEQAGHTCKIIKGIEDLRWGSDGEVLDEEGAPLRWVWKTWAWETALDQIRRECDEDEQRGLIRRGGVSRRAPKPRLIDVLLRPEVRVFEPFWTLIPSNKAILPILWHMFPEHPHLLHAQFELDDALRQSGYVRKPIAGRCGSNITMVSAEHGVMEDSTEGRFGHQELIYQELAPLPVLDGRHVQLCAFAVEGQYAGACVRVDRSRVITKESDVLPLRLLSDAHWKPCQDT